MKSITSLLLFLLLGSLCHAQVKDDEEIIFFPSSAHLDPVSKQWIIPIHGWVFEREAGSLFQSLSFATFTKALELTTGQTHNPLFVERAQLFLVDNERGKEITVGLKDHRRRMRRSAANGHFHGELRLPRDGIHGEDEALIFRSYDERIEAKSFEGKVHFVKPVGLSVISDIDDTIKISMVNDKKELLKNSFLRPFKAVPHMADFYANLKEKGAAFHYLSSSPWQLYPSLAKFIKVQKFPAGSFHLKTIRVKDASILQLFASPMDTKVPQISAIFDRYPGRKFILIGDSGEKDPEVYGHVARKYPLQIQHIYIRNVTNINTHKSRRLRKAFSKVPTQKWTLFKDAKPLK